VVSRGRSARGNKLTARPIYRMLARSAPVRSSPVPVGVPADPPNMGALEHDRIVVAGSSSRSCARLWFFGLAGPIGRVGTMRQRLWLKPGARGFRLTTPFLALGAAGVGFEPTIEVAPVAGFQDL
jgi:hypothetical protein